MGSRSQLDRTRLRHAQRAGPVGAGGGSGWSLPECRVTAILVAAATARPT